MTARLTLRPTAEEKLLIRTAAAALGISMSEFIRRALTDYLDKYDQR